MSSYRNASIQQPIETSRASKIVITGVEVSHTVNVSVSRTGVGRLQSLALLGKADGSDAPRWSTYGHSFTVTKEAPGQAVAALHVIDPTKDASAGPFVVTYEDNGQQYRTDAVLVYRVAARACH